MDTGSYQPVDEQWLRDHGSLHDTCILAWHAQGGSTTFRLHDVWWNFEGLPEYKGPESGSLVISNTRQNPDCEPLVSKMILEASLVQGNGAMGLRLVTGEHPPIDIFGETIRWYPEGRR